ncbi:hypothetical protein [Mariprofundus ferrooxydans]|uniref:hypothetical protein n=1 Tax=Mariprofundus ferrooxydans TaxID=314344 RepID=UPI00198238C7|nr:hypothetical protein [Mariprofundus ferrooxydans]
MMENRDDIKRWLETSRLEAADIDCVTTVMLKILDGKCKMSESGKQVMIVLYDLVKDRPGRLLGANEHTLIAEARATHPGEAERMQIYERRLLAETMISRPVMKAFKAMLRAEGVIASL